MGALKDEAKGFKNAVVEAGSALKSLPEERISALAPRRFVDLDGGLSVASGRSGRLGLGEPARLSLGGAVSTVPVAPDLSFGLIGGEEDPAIKAANAKREALEKERESWAALTSAMNVHAVAQAAVGQISAETMETQLRQNAVIDVAHGLQQAANSALQQWILGQSKLGPALRASTAQVLASIAARAMAEGLYMTGIGIAALTPWGAATFGPASIWFKAAATEFAIGGITGGLAAGLAQGGNATAGAPGSPLNPVVTRNIGGSAEQGGQPMQVTVQVNALDPASVNWDRISQNIADSLGRYLERGGSAGPVQISFERN